MVENKVTSQVNQVAPAQNAQANPAQNAQANPAQGPVKQQVTKQPQNAQAKATPATTATPAINISGKGIKKRSIFLVYLFFIITFGLYGVYWIVSTKREINSLGANIPNAILAFIPVVNIVWLIMYISGFSKIIKKDDKVVGRVFLFLFLGFLMPGIVQKNMNKLATR